MLQSGDDRWHDDSCFGAEHEKRNGRLPAHIDIVVTKSVRHGGNDLVIVIADTSDQIENGLLSNPGIGILDGSHSHASFGFF